MTPKRSTSIIKISPPVLKNVYPRERLFDRLDNLLNRPIVWVSGPAGCGKTSAVASYIKDRQLPCIWYQMDEGDADPATFIYYLGLASKKAAPWRKKALPLLAPEYLPGLATFARRFFEDFHNRLKSSTLFVIDNFQDLPSASATHKIIKIALETLPSDINTIMISRSAPPSKWARLKANRKLGLLSWKDLQLNRQESDAIATLQLDKPLSNKTIHYLQQITDGWAAGFVLMLEAVKGEDIDPDLTTKLPHQDIIDYFGTEVFDRSSQITQQFLLHTAYLPKIDVSLAEQLTGNPRAKHILAELNRQNQFTERHFHSSPTYRYHPLFRDFLMAKAEQSLTSRAIDAICRKAARRYEKNGDTESAAALLIQVKDWDLLVALINENGPTLLEQGRGLQLKSWIEQLPEDYMRKDPWICYWMGISMLPDTHDDSCKHLNVCYQKFKSSRDDVGRFKTWISLVDATIYSMNRFFRLDQLIKDIYQNLNAYEAISDLDIKASVASRMVIALAHRQTQNPEIESWANRAIDLCDSIEDLHTRAITLCYLTQYYIFTGDFARAAEVIEDLRFLIRVKDVSPLIRISLKIDEALLNFLSGNHKDCIKAVQEGIEVAEDSGIFTLSNMLLAYAAQSCLYERDFSQAKEPLASIEKRLEHLRPLELSKYHSLKTYESLINENYAKALVDADLAIKHGSKAGSPFNMKWCQLLKAQALHHLGKHKKADRYLNEVIKYATHYRHQNIKYYAYLFSAYAAMQKGEESKVTAYLQKALSLGKENDYVKSFYEVPATTEQLYQRALQDGIEVDYVRSIINRTNLTPANPPVHLESWPWPLRIYTLGRFSLVKDNQSVRFSGKVQHKPLGLLKALIAFGGRDVPEGKMLDALWPQTEGDLAHRSFVTTLHRLRKLLGSHEALVLQNYSLTLDAKYCWVDVWAFERLLGEAENAWKQGPGNGQTAARFTKTALEFYNGPFLAQEVVDHWITTYHNRLEQKYLKGIDLLGKYYEASENWEAAADLYLRGLNVDSMLEYLYRRLMVCQLNLGRRTEAMKTFNRCQDTLESQNMKLSSATTAIFKSLQK